VGGRSRKKTRHGNLRRRSTEAKKKKKNYCTSSKGESKAAGREDRILIPTKRERKEFEIFGGS